MVTITDVAALAGVSRQTVSRVLNAEPTVAPATRGRVDDAIVRLNYRPSAAARALATRRSRTIGLISTGAPLYGPSSTMLGVNEAARAAGYRVSIASLTTGDRDGISDAVDALLQQNVEALVLIAADFTAVDAVRGLDAGVPLVTAESSGRPGLHSVSIDQFAGARLVTRHLIELGHRRILHLAGPTGSVDASERARGWRAELESAGLPVIEPEVGDWFPASGHGIGSSLARGALRGPDAATAVFSSNDQMALGLLHALSDAGLRVPTDVSIAGFDDVPEAEHFLPPLTTVRQDFSDLGARMMATVLDVLRGHPPAEPVHTSPTLVVRASTAAPPALLRYGTVSVGVDSAPWHGTSMT